MREDRQPNMQTFSVLLTPKWKQSNKQLITDLLQDQQLTACDTHLNLFPRRKWGEDRKGVGQKRGRDENGSGKEGDRLIN